MHSGNLVASIIQSELFAVLEHGRIVPVRPHGPLAVNPARLMHLQADPLQIANKQMIDKQFPARTDVDDAIRRVLIQILGPTAILGREDERHRGNGGVPKKLSMETFHFVGSMSVRSFKLRSNSIRSK